MYWTLELASKMEDAPWPATKDELLEWAMRVGLPQEVVENLNEIEDEGEIYERIEDIWPDYPTKDDRLGSPVGLFLSKNCPKTAQKWAKRPKYFPRTITKSS